MQFQARDRKGVNLCVKSEAQQKRRAVIDSTDSFRIMLVVGDGDGEDRMSIE